MPSLKAIRKRISSTKSTQKITRAMKMVAGARLTRAQQRITALRPYAVKTSEVLHSVARTMGLGGSASGPGGASAESQTEPAHPLLASRPEKKALYVVVSADRGLCGGLNTNLNKLVEREWRELAGAGVEVTFATLGRKGREYLTRRGGTVTKDWAKAFDKIDIEKARGIAGWLVPRFEKGEVDAIYLVFNEFKSAMTQKATTIRLLPIAADAPPPPDATGTGATDFLYEPDRRALLERIVPMYVEITVYRALLESQASFFGAQMTAMDAATRNAKDMIARLTLQFNRARQAAITKELMEIIGGAEALKD
jgi:F-type H+-transporting ATPase subunit gamma